MQCSSFQQVSILPSTGMDAHSKSRSRLQTSLKSFPCQSRTHSYQWGPTYSKATFILQTTAQGSLERTFRSSSGLDSVDHYTSIYTTALSVVFGFQEMGKSSKDCHCLLAAFFGVSVPTASIAGKVNLYSASAKQNYYCCLRV